MLKTYTEYEPSSLRDEFLSIFIKNIIKYVILIIVWVVYAAYWVFSKEKTQIFTLYNRKISGKLFRFIPIY